MPNPLHGTRDVHGTGVRFTAHATLATELEDVLLRYPSAESGECALSIAVDRGEPGPPHGGRSFFFGALEGVATPTGFVLASAEARVAVDFERGQIDAVARGRSDDLRIGLMIGLGALLRTHGLYQLHAAAVTTARGTHVLLVGGSGAGKTSSLLGLVSAGAVPTADDIVFLQRRPASSPRVLGHPRTYHLTPDTLERFPDLAGAVVDAPTAGGKLAVDPRIWNGQRENSRLARVDVVAFPRVVGTETAVRALPSAEAFGSILAQGSFGLLPGAPGLREQLDTTADLVAHAACVELHLAADSLATPTLLADALDRARIS